MQYCSGSVFIYLCSSSNVTNKGKIIFNKNNCILLLNSVFMGSLIILLHKKYVILNNNLLK